jgi:hypothetical protein
MKLDETANNRQPDTQPSVRAAGLSLPEHLEHVRQKDGVDAAAGVGDGQNDVRPLRA